MKQKIAQKIIELNTGNTKAASKNLYKYLDNEEKKISTNIKTGINTQQAKKILKY